MMFLLGQGYGQEEFVRRMKSSLRGEMTEE